MRLFTNITALSVLLLVSSAVEAKVDCPPREKGVVPWNTPGLMEGDRWAWVYLKINTRGTPTSCGIGENNLSDGARSKVCRSFIRNWRATPVLQNGKPISTTIKRHFVIIGRKHEKAYDEARKKFFEEHPEERRECYPE
jgi:hypothetical protein